MIRFFIIVFFLLLSADAWAQASSLGFKLLKNYTLIKVEKDGTKVIRTEYEFNVETDAGRLMLANFKAGFSGDPKNFKLIEAYSLTQGLKTVTPPDVKIMDSAASNLGVSDGKLALIPVNNVQVGSFARIVYETRTIPDLTGNMNEVVQLQAGPGAQPGSVRFESAIPLKFVTFGYDDYFEAKSSQKDGLYILDAAPSKKGETASLLRIGLMYVSSSASWEQINKQVSPEYQKVWGSDLPEVFKKMVAGAKALKTPKEQIAFVTREISNQVSYSGNWSSSRGRYFPQDLKKMAVDKRGDCKDYATILVAVLRQLGFTAFPALVMKSEAYAGEERLTALSKLPGLNSFNHVMVWAQDSTKKEWWLDPTNPFVTPNIIMNDILGNYALILDGTSKDVRFLPAKNEIMHDTMLFQTLKINPDMTVESKGHYVLNDSTYSTLAQYQKLKGPSITGVLINQALLPKEQLQIVVSPEKRMEKYINYGFDYISKNLVKAPTEKTQKLILPHPLMPVLQRMNADAQSYIGEVGMFMIETTITNAQSPYSYEEDCFARSPWVDAERTIVNSGNDIVVTDFVLIKTRMIYEAEAKSDRFYSYVPDMMNCAKKDSITLITDPSEKTPARLAIEKELGPSVYQMTDQDAAKLLGLHGRSFSLEIQQKLYKYYTLKLKKDKKNVAYIAGQANAIMQMGRLNRVNFLKAYLDEALAVTDEAFESTDKTQDRTALLQSRYYAFLRLGVFKEALNLLKLYNASEKNRFAKYMTASDMFLYQRKYTQAEKWIQAGEKLATTTEEKIDVAERLYQALTVQGQSRKKEGLELLQKMVELEPENPLRLHHLAIAHLDMKNFTETIALEKKVLEKVDLRAAKTMMAEAYLQLGLIAEKQEAEPPVPKGVRNVASAPSSQLLWNPGSETLFNEALKWNENSTAILTKVIQTNLLKATKEKDPVPSMNRAKLYLQKLTQLEPTQSVIPVFTKAITDMEAILQKKK